MIKLVLDVATESSGGLAVLLQYYYRARQDYQNHWYFIVSAPNLTEDKNITVYKYPWVKKNWFYRLYFDTICLPKIINKINPTEVYSLQGTYSKRIKSKQIIYMQQMLSFTDEKVNLFLEPKLWFYRYIMSIFERKAVIDADAVVVQIESTRKACIDKTRTAPEKYIIEYPSYGMKVRSRFEKNQLTCPTFFYPSTALSYKNHFEILKAMKMLRNDGYNNYKMVFTINGTENSYSKQLRKFALCEDLPVEFVGWLSRDKMEFYYTRSILVYPSKVESFGFPLLEGAMYNTPIIAINLVYVHDVLGQYDKVTYYERGRIDLLSEAMKRYLE